MKLSLFLLLGIVTVTNAASKLRTKGGSEAHKGDNQSKKNERKLIGYEIYFDNEDFGFEQILSICFSSYTTVTDVLNKGKNVPMDQIEVGDRVMTSNGKYETVYTIDHRNPTKLTEFLQIETTGEHEQSLELSERHMVFLEGKKNPVPAFVVKAGDQLKTIGSENGEPRTVKTINKITREGVFSPLTTGDGTIVVAGGIVASVYSAFMSNNEYVEVDGQSTSITHQELFQTIVKPYKLFCTAVSMELCKSTNGKTSISKLAELSLNYWFQSSNSFQTVSLVVVLAAARAIDVIFSYFSLFAVLALAVAMHSRSKSSTRKKID